MAETATLFQLPVDPEQFGVLLPPAELRKIDFSALEFSTARRAVIEYIKTYYKDDFNDFVSNNGVIMLVELLSYLTALMSMRADVLSNEAFLPTAQSENAIVNHLALISQKIRRATPASIDMEYSVVTQIDADINIPAGLTYQVRGEDGVNIKYEVYRAPGDFTSPITIPAGKTGVIAHGLEGTTKTYTVKSDGSANQRIVMVGNDILEEPITILVKIGNITYTWDRVDFIETAGPTDKSYEARFFQDELDIVFGNGTYGAIPDNNSTITVRYRTGGGTRGKIDRKSTV